MANVVSGILKPNRLESQLLLKSNVKTYLKSNYFPKISLNPWKHCIRQTNPEFVVKRPGANVSRALARTGVDWVLVDMEHGNIDGM